MTVFNDTFDKATPAGTDDPSEADDRMREIKAAVQERENVDHYWPLTGTEVSDANAGEHRKVTFNQSIANPTQVASKAHLYMKDDELFYQDDTNTAKQLTNSGKLNIVDADGAVVKTGNQTIAGIKTFSSSPIVPAPTTDLQAATKKYVDDQADPTYSGGESHTFAGGLIIKSGYAIRTGGSQAIAFGASFPNAIVSVTVTEANNAVSVPNSSAVGSVTVSGFNVANATAISGYYWTAIGY